jgi:predicted NAD/FAD-dependent oxidoreductase
MNRLARYLAAELDVLIGIHVESVSVDGSAWQVRHPGGSLAASALILTAPVPQSLELLDAGQVSLDAEVRSWLDRIRYHPTLALLVVSDGPTALSGVGAAQLSEGPFSFVADNAVKGVSDEPALTFHASAQLSADLWEADDAEGRAVLMGHAEKWLGDSGAVEVQLKRWRYAQPSAPAGLDLEATAVRGRPLVLAGDAFAGGKVEGAFRSGRAAALHLDALLSGRA